MLSDRENKYSIAQKVILFHLYYHCQLMYDYLTETGKIVPKDISSEMAEINLRTHPLFLEYNKIKSEKGFSKELEFEYHTKIASVLEGDRKKLTKFFNILTKLSKPASPCTLENTLPSWRIFGFFGQKCAPFACYMYWNGIIYLLGYILTGLFIGFAESDSFMFKFNTQAILFFSAGLGGSLYALITSRRYLINRTFDNKFVPHYINRILIGIITGFILASLVTPSVFKSTEGIVERLTPSMLALLGGFSADAVIQIMKRLVATISTVIEGDSKDLIESMEQKIKTKMEADKLKHNMEYVAGLQQVLTTAGLTKDSAAFKKINEIIRKIKEDEEYITENEGTA